MAISKKTMAEGRLALAQAMPAELHMNCTAAEPEEILSQSWAGDIQSWEVALNALAPTMSQKQLDSALRLVGSNAESRYSDARGALAMGQALMEKGASPFAKNKHEDPGAWVHRRSFFGSLLSGGYWAYAAKIASEPGNREKCLAEAVAESPEVWTGREMKLDGPGKLLARGGAPGFKLGFIMGMSPNDLVDGRPWFFLCETSEHLAACMEAGADLSLTTGENYLDGGSLSGSNKRTFEELLCLGAGINKIDSAERSSMVSMIRARGATLDQAAGRRVLEGMAPRGTWAEVKKLQKTYGLDAAKMESSNGAGMLELSLAAGNWMLARNLMAAGANPYALSKRTGLPVIAEALWTEPSKSHEASRRAEGPAALRKRKECEEAILAALDVEWRSEDGESLLTMAKNVVAKNARNKPGGRGPQLSTAGIGAMIERCKLDASDPLWRRLAQVDAPVASIRKAALLRDEPWICEDGVGLLSILLRARGGEVARSGNYQFGFDHMKQFAESLQQMDDKDNAFARAKELFSPEQWSSAWLSWSAAHAYDREQNRALEASMVFAIRGWLDLAKGANMDAGEIFDYPLMGNLVSLAWRDVSPNSDLRDAALIAAGEICRACPAHGGSILMDVLAIQKSWAMDAAMKSWDKVERDGVKIAIPEGHALFKEPGIVGEVLCCHPFWRRLEARLVSEASAPKSSGMRM